MFSFRPTRLASPGAINILTRLMGLILAAVAVKFITDGLAQLLPRLAAPS
jgi:small neutral amino acid transporter SnatA (MarC family)